MSNFLVSRAHIDAILNAFRVHGQGSIIIRDEVYFHADRAALSKLGRILWTANAQTYHDTYPSEFADVDVGTAGDYTFPASPSAVKPSPVAALKLCNCLEYQCCDAAGWARSDAYVVLAEIMRAVTYALDGYEAAPWSI